MKDATLAQGNQVTNLILQKKLSAEQIQALLASGLLADVLDCHPATINRDDVRVALGLPRLIQEPVFEAVPMIVTVTEDATIESLVIAGGYKFASPYMESTRFKITVRGKRKLFLARCDDGAEPEEMATAAKKIPQKELALIEDLLVLGTHPEYQDLPCSFPILCLGSTALFPSGRQEIAYLSLYPRGGRILEHFPWSGVGGMPQKSRVLLVGT